jgi:aspartyl-tRNA synthetase
MPETYDATPLAPNPYRELRCGSLRTVDIGARVRLAGWLAAKRDHGGLLFVDLRDPVGPEADLPVPGGEAGGPWDGGPGAGSPGEDSPGEDGPGDGGYLQGDHRARVVQLVCHPGGPAFEPLSRLRLESVVSVSGQVVARPSATVNPKLLTGEIEVDVDGVEVLSSSEVLPFPVERDTDVGEEARLTYRYLDMRRGPLAERLAKRARFCQLVRSHLSARGFLEVQTPVLTASSPEGARDYLVPSRLYPGEF